MGWDVRGHNESPEPIVRWRVDNLNQWGTRVSEPEDKVVPLLPAQLVRVERSIDETLENLRAQRDELSLVIAKLSDGLAVIDQASTAQATDQVRKLIELLAVAQSQLDELSVGIERLERKF